MTAFTCKKCGKQYPIDYHYWKCNCGGIFKISELHVFDKNKIIDEDLSLWRYRHALPLEEKYQPVTMAEGMTPLIPLDNNGSAPLVKLDYLCPTGSFKDRGSTVLISVLKAHGVQEIVEDSSGNAGASMAAYSARGGIKCHIFAPASASAEKLKRIEGFGALLTRVEGPREKATEEVIKKAESIYYASHWANPLFLQGTKTFAYEVWEQLHYKAPDVVIMPVGHGSNILGSYIGFKELKEANLIGKLPRLIAVQSAACSPISSQFAGKEFNPAAKAKPIAEGIAIKNPPRKDEILNAIKETKGMAYIVNDEEIYAAWKYLCAHGLYVELTSAVAFAGYSKMSKNELLNDLSVVISLTGRN
jgi:threonine synthase